MKKTIKRIVDVIMVIALIASIGLAVYLLVGQGESGAQINSDGTDFQGNSTVVKRRASSN